MQSLSLKTTELAAEKTSRATVLKEVEGRFAKVDLPATHLQKELATARAGNKKADAYALPLPLPLALTKIPQL